MESLRRWREKNGVTQAQLAADLSVHPSAVSKLEHGAMQPDVRTLYRLARRTEIPVMDLLRESIGEDEPALPARHSTCPERRRKRAANARRNGPD